MSGALDPGDGVLTVRLDPLPTQRATTAIAQLCEHLTSTQTHYPGTNLILRYEVKTHPRPPKNFPTMSGVLKVSGSAGRVDGCAPGAPRCDFVPPSERIHMLVETGGEIIDVPRL
jgi:hypothetical protein